MSFFLATLPFLFPLAGVLLAQTPIAPDPDEGFGPFVAMLLLLGVFAVCLILVGIGIVLALAGVVCTAVLAALGIVSTSAVVALWQRRVTAGVRAFHYQVCAAVAAPAGVIGLWAALTLSGRAVPLRWVVPFGLAGGVVAGVLLAAIGDWTLRTAYRRLRLQSPDGSPSHSLF